MGFDFFIFINKLACLSQAFKPWAVRIRRIAGILSGISEYIDLVGLVCVSLKVGIQSSNAFLVLFLFPSSGSVSNKCSLPLHQRSIIAVLACVSDFSHHEQRGTFQRVSAISSNVGRLKCRPRVQRTKEMEEGCSPFCIDNSGNLFE